MIKIVHIADIHLDSPFTGESMETKKLKRDELKSAFLSVCDYCKKNNTDILLIAGDLFDGDFVRRETVSFVAECLSRVPSRVFIAPGNHDAYSSASPYKYCSFPDNVHIFTSESLEAVEIPELHCAVYGYGFTDTKMKENPTAGIHPQDTSRTNILVCHGDFDTPTSDYYNIKLSDIASSELDYVAMGHIHKPSGIMELGKTLCAYSGCLMGRNFSECGKRGIIAGTVGKSGSSLEYISLSDKTYEEITVDITEKTLRRTVEEIQEKAGAFSPKSTIRVILTGERESENTMYSDIASYLAPNITVKDKSSEKVMYNELLNEYSLRGAFARMLRPYMESSDEKTAQTASLALKYGLEALKK